MKTQEVRLNGDCPVCDEYKGIGEHEGVLYCMSCDTQFPQTEETVDALRAHWQAARRDWEREC